MNINSSEASNNKRNYSAIDNETLDTHSSHKKPKILSEEDSKILAFTQSYLDRLKEAASYSEKECSISENESSGSTLEDSLDSSSEDESSDSDFSSTYESTLYERYIRELHRLPVEWQKRLSIEYLNEERIEHLLNLLSNEQTKELTDYQKKIIFNIIYAFENKKLLLASVNLILPIENRNDLLRKALIYNDLELAEAAIIGSEGQKPINFDDWSHQRPFITIQYLKDKGTSSEMIAKLCSISILDQNDLIEGEWKLFLFNLVAFEEETFYLKGEIIDYDGGFCHLFDPKILNSLTGFIELNADENLKNMFRKLCDLISSGDKQKKPAEKHRIYSETGSLLIHGGNRDHALDIYFTEDYFFVCNLGEHSPAPVVAYKIVDRKLINEELIEYIEKTVRKFTSKKMGNYFYKTLPKLLSGGEEYDPLTDLFFKNWIGSLEQEGSDCVIASTRAAMCACAAMHLFIHDRNEASIAKGLKLVDEWNWNFLEKEVLDYEQYGLENPNRIDNLFLKRICEKLIKKLS